MKARVHERKRFVAGRESIDRVVALCDADLLGKVFEQGDLCLDLSKSRSFYDGEKVSEQQAIELLKTPGANLNLVGEKSLGAARKALRINEAAVKKISGVPVLQIYRL